MNSKTILAVSLAAVFAVSVFTLPSAFASVGLAKKNPNFDITDVSGFTMTVDGTAGATTPKDQSHVFAYVFVLDTSDETTTRAYAVTSHYAEDSDDVVDDIAWHTHYVELQNGCVSSIADAGELPTLSGDEVIAVGASGTVVAGLTAVLNIDRGAGSVCVQSVIDVQSAS